MNTRSSTRMRVRQVADELLAKGTKPTVALVRAETGGSDTTVSDELQRWWAGLGKRLTAREALPGVPDALATPVNELWAAALDQAHESLAQARRTLDEQRQALEAQFRQAKQELDGALSLAQAERQDALTQVATIRQEMAAEAERRTAAERMAGETKARLADRDTLIEEMTAKAARTEAQLDELKSDLTTERVGREADSRHWTLQLDEQRQRTKTLQQRVIALETHLGALTTQLDQSKQEAATHLRDRERIETRLTAELEHAQQQLGESGQSVARLQATIDANNAGHEEKLTGLRVKLGVAKSRAAEAEKQLAAANARCEALVVENASLRQASSDARDGDKGRS